MVDYIKTEHPDYIRDPHSKALIFNNSKAIDEYTLKTKMFEGLRQHEDRINNLETKTNEIIDILKEIKTLLGNKA